MDIAYIRQSLGITQHELAEYLETSQVQVARFETGSRIPSDTLTAKLSDLSNAIGICSLSPPDTSSIANAHATELLTMRNKLLKANENDLFRLKQQLENMMEEYNACMKGIDLIPCMKENQHKFPSIEIDWLDILLHKFQVRLRECSPAMQLILKEKIAGVEAKISFLQNYST